MGKYIFFLRRKERKRAEKRLIRPRIWIKALEEKAKGKKSISKSNQIIYFACLQ